jgi:hypothetical protein
MESFRRILPSRKPRTQDVNLELRQRPRISAPFPMPERSVSPPFRPPRPVSLTDSLMEEMRITPQPPRLNYEESNSIHDESENTGRSMSPPPLRIFKNGQTSSPFGPDLERNARVASSVYSTDVERTKPRPSLYQNPELSRWRLGEGGPYLAYSNTDDKAESRAQLQRIIDDPPVRRLQHNETLRRLEHGVEPRGMTKTSEDEDEVKSENSYDFAQARAKKVLADKRMREGYDSSSRAESPTDLPAIPELPGQDMRWR